jgi:hypothetical protein
LVPRCSSAEIPKSNPKITLKNAPRNPDSAFVLANDDAELHGLPIGIPSGILGEVEEHGGSVRRGASQTISALFIL